MRLFKRGDSLERRLAAERARPTDALVSLIVARVREAPPARQRHSSYRVAIPVALAAGMIGALAAVGGVGYAASSVERAAKVVSKAFAPATTQKVVVIEGLTAGGDQYKPGFAFGDPAHNHAGPPNLTVAGGAFAPPLTVRTVGKLATVSTSFTIDAQAHLYISVIDAKTKQKLQIDQKGSKVGSKGGGVPVKTLSYLVLVPRKIPLTLALPSNLVKAGVSYDIKIIAVNPKGQKKTLVIHFGG